MVEAGSPLPEAITNNAVAAHRSDGRDRIFSFLGLGAGKDFRAITSSRLGPRPHLGDWEALPDVPGAVGRIAATAQALRRPGLLVRRVFRGRRRKETTSSAVDIYDVRDRAIRGARIFRCRSTTPCRGSGAIV